MGALGTLALSLLYSGRCYFARRPSLILCFIADFHGHRGRCTISLEIVVSTNWKRNSQRKCIMMKWWVTWRWLMEAEKCGRGQRPFNEHLFRNIFFFFSFAAPSSFWIAHVCARTGYGTCCCFSYHYLLLFHFGYMRSDNDLGVRPRSTPSSAVVWLYLSEWDCAQATHVSHLALFHFLDSFALNVPLNVLRFHLPLGCAPCFFFSTIYFSLCSH